LQYKRAKIPNFRPSDAAPCKVPPGAAALPRPPFPPPLILHHHYIDQFHFSIILVNSPAHAHVSYASISRYSPVSLYFHHSLRWSETAIDCSSDATRNLSPTHHLVIRE